MPNLDNNILEISNYVNLDDDDTAINYLCDRWGDMIAPPTQQVRRVIAACYKRLNDWDVRYAIDETAIAPNPSLRYFMAICRRLETAAAEKEGGSPNV